MRYFGLAVLSAAVLLLEVTLTRIYSVTQGYHFAFLAVSLGLLGFGASGTVLFVAPRLWRRTGHRLLTFSALLFTLTALGSYWAINRIPFDAYRLTLEPTMFLYLILFFLTPVVPFFFAGLVVGGSMSLEPKKAPRIYGSSLVGSGVGAALPIVEPASLGPAWAIGMVGTLGVVAWMAFSLRYPLLRTSTLMRAVASIGLLAAAWGIPHTIELQISPYKALPQVLRQQGAELAWTEWNAFSRVDVIRSEGLHSAPGLSLTYRQSLPPQIGLTVDGDNLSSITAAMPGGADFTKHLPTAVAYDLARDPSVLIVEPGGGLDLLTALQSGADRVLALIGNPLEAELLQGQFAAEAAGVFTDPRVHVVAGSPRAYLARTDEPFDLVVVSLRDAFRTITAGAYSLSENYLYTTEAFQAYFEHLEPGGLLMATRWVQTPPSEELRMVATAVEALEGMGVSDLENKLVLLRTLQTLTLLAKKEPFTPMELEKVQAFAQSQQMDLSYLPGLDPKELNQFFILPQEVYFVAVSQLLDRAKRQEVYDEQTFDVAPATDDRPFFFHFFRWRQIGDVLDHLGEVWLPFGGAGFLVILGFLGISVLMSGVLILVPLLLMKGLTKEGDGAGSRGLSLGALVYFLALGLGFLWLELPLMQRFILLLDQPTYSFGVVLFAILVFSGIGSLLSARLGRYQTWAILALSLVGLVYYFGTTPFVQLMLGLPLAARIPIAVLAIAPLALLMGIHFPSGIAALGDRRPALIPWAWGANGYASVVGSALAALMALSWGFSTVTLAASALYLLAWVMFHFYLRAITPAKMEQSGHPPG